MTIMVTGIIGDQGVIYKLFDASCSNAVFHSIWNCSLCDLYLAAVQIFCDLYGVFYFIIGPMFDFLYLVMIYAVFVDRMIGVYDSRKGKEVWKWS